MEYVARGSTTLPSVNPLPVGFIDSPSKLLVQRPSQPSATDPHHHTHAHTHAHTPSTPGRVQIPLCLYFASVICNKDRQRDRKLDPAFAGIFLGGSSDNGRGSVTSHSHPSITTTIATKDSSILPSTPPETSGLRLVTAGGFSTAATLGLGHELDTADTLHRDTTRQLQNRVPPPIKTEILQELPFSNKDYPRGRHKSRKSQQTGRSTDDSELTGSGNWLADSGYHSHIIRSPSCHIGVVTPAVEHKPVHQPATEIKKKRSRTISGRMEFTGSKADVEPHDRSLGSGLQDSTLEFDTAEERGVEGQEGVSEHGDIGTDVHDESMLPEHLTLSEPVVTGERNRPQPEVLQDSKGAFGSGSIFPEVHTWLGRSSVRDLSLAQQGPVEENVGPLDPSELFTPEELEFIEQSRRPVQSGEKSPKEKSGSVSPYNDEEIEKSLLDPPPRETRFSHAWAIFDKKSTGEVSPSPKSPRFILIKKSI